MLRKVGDWVLDDQADTLSCGETRRKIERRAMAALVHLTNQRRDALACILAHAGAKHLLVIAENC